MYVNNYLQVYVFLYTLYGGIIIGIVYDLVDVIINGHIIKKRSFTDLVFWAIAFGIIIGILFYVNNITIRSYVFVGFIVGWLLYFYVLSRLIRKFLLLLQKMFGMMYYRIAGITKIILMPLKKLLNLGKKTTSKIKTVRRRIFSDFKKYKRYLHKD